MQTARGMLLHDEQKRTAAAGALLRRRLRSGRKAALGRIFAEFGFGHAAILGAAMPDQARRLFAGGSGFSYKEWCGGLSGRGEDRRHARVVRRSAYLLSRSTTPLPHAAYRDARALGRKMPEHFGFAIKASRRITHIERLKGEETPFGPVSVRELGASATSSVRCCFSCRPISKRICRGWTRFCTCWPRAWGHARVSERELVRRRGVHALRAREQRCAWPRARATGGAAGGDRELGVHAAAARGILR